jgi:hypothetical protein
VRGSNEDLEVVVFRTLGAMPRPRFRSRRPKRAEPGATPPEPVPIARVTVISADGFDDEDAAKRWLERCRKNEDAREQEANAALRVLNVALHAQRISAGNPYVHDVSRRQAHCVRLGYGSGEEVVDGRWHDACVLPDPASRGGRRQVLAPQEQVAAILSGRSPAHVSEDLVLRARLDLDQGRARAAAFQLRVAADVLEAELREAESGGDELGRLRDMKGKLAALAEAALHSELDANQASELHEALEQLERAIRRRRHKGR